MWNKLSRRVFLAITGGALVSRAAVLGKEEVPSLLDHILLGCSTLESGIAFVEERTGVKAVFGGVHPGRGTENALLSLGPRRYLEIIAPDPKQGRVEQFSIITELKEPKLIGWAAHPGSLDEFAKKLTAAGVPFEGPRDGSRARPDGRMLRWKTLNLKDDTSGLLPFFIEWSADSPHPSADAPKGCSLVRFEAATPDPDALSKQIAILGLDLPVVKADKPQLRATVAGPKGSSFDINS